MEQISHDGAIKKVATIPISLPIAFDANGSHLLTSGAMNPISSPRSAPAKSSTAHGATAYKTPAAAAW